MRLQALTFASAIAILSILIAVLVRQPTIHELKEYTMPPEQIIENPGLPEYHSIIEGIDVNTYCDRMPDDFTGTCAAWHLQRVAELEAALGI